MNKKYLIPLTICSVIVAAVSFIKLNKDTKAKKKQTKKVQNVITEQNEDDENSEELEDRVLYDNDVTDPEEFSLLIHEPKYNSNIDHLSYRILLNLNKGTNYEGVVRIKTVSNRKTANKSPLFIDFSGKSIMFLSVNGHKIEEDQVVYNRHQVQVKKQWLDPEYNHIEIIFSNKYAFMGDGLTTYFPLDDNNKYSLKGQVIYTRNGIMKVSRMFPCLNILNNCEVRLQVLHPDNFQTFSNTPRSLVRVTSRQDYPYYSFFFQASDRKFTRSFALGASSFKDNNSSIRSFEEIVKSNTQFYEAKLNSIHDFFLLCSAISEVRPSNTTMSSKNMLIRYFSKQAVSRKASSLLNILNCQICQIYSRIEKFKLEKSMDLEVHRKIDIFFIDDYIADGDFYGGSIFLDEQTIERGVCDRRVFYLLCRAFIGMSLLEKNYNQLMYLQGQLYLNELTLEIFPECIDFIYGKLKVYQILHQNCLTLIDKKDKSMSFWFQDYYEKQIRYFVRKLNEEKVSQQVYSLIRNIDELSNQYFWTQFVSAHSFLESSIAETLMKMGIKEKGIPTSEAELDYAKNNLGKSKYYLKFFTNQQIQNNLRAFIEKGSIGIQKKVPFIKIKEKYLIYIDETLQKYLNIKSNRLEAKNLYEQFKRYNESRNFHHISALRREIKRIRLLAKDNIEEQNKDLECGLMGWKLLRKLEILPKNPSTLDLVNSLESNKLVLM